MIFTLCCLLNKRLYRAMVVVVVVRRYARILCLTCLHSAIYVLNNVFSSFSFFAVGLWLFSTFPSFFSPFLLLFFFYFSKFQSLTRLPFLDVTVAITATRRKWLALTFCHCKKVVPNLEIIHSCPDNSTSPRTVGGCFWEASRLMRFIRHQRHFSYSGGYENPN